MISISTGKRAQLGEQIMFPAVFFVMVMIATGIAIGTAVYFGSGYEFRNAGASALNHKIRQCIFESKSIDLFKDDFHRICKISKEVIDNNNMFFRVCIGEEAEKCLLSDDYAISTGGNFEACFLEGAKGNKNYPRCTVREFSFNGEHYSVITGSNQQIRRINA